ncbi:hypothetical protein [Streptosporangium sp. OZ121]|uniref:hypothetical protein n=1 Tax=Streptosporangium sp. OZ121 TaxID=3444183 RepID=UPI003F78D2C2
MGEWRPSACILCECNCGVEILVGRSGAFDKIRGEGNHLGGTYATATMADRP